MIILICDHNVFDFAMQIFNVKCLCMSLCSYQLNTLSNFQNLIKQVFLLLFSHQLTKTTFTLATKILFRITKTRSLHQKEIDLVDILLQNCLLALHCHVKIKKFKQIGSIFRISTGPVVKYPANPSESCNGGYL